MRSTKQSQIAAMKYLAKVKPDRYKLELRGYYVRLYEFKYCHIWGKYDIDLFWEIQHVRKNTILH